jgi:serine/threonine protein kinase
MTDHVRLDSGEWDRLEALWERVFELPQSERFEFIRTLDVDDALRAELYALVSRSAAAEAFFHRFQSFVPGSTPDPPSLDDDTSGRRSREHRSVRDPDSLLGTMVNQYRIEVVLGVGGMGVVYRAVDTRLQRTVALKLLRQQDDDARAKDRLIAEARSAAALDHPNICTVHEVGETANHTWFIAMAHYGGETLDRVLLRGPPPLAVALNYATQIARGLGAAHERGIIHRDVKPANIIVTRDGTVKLLDFGIAQRTDNASFSRLTPGTIAYMSPEQVANRPADSRTDLWSVGVVLFELCTGARPFDREDVGATIRAILQDDAPSVTSVRPGLPAKVDAIIQRLLNKSPTQRYPDTAALIADLRLPDARRVPHRRAWRRIRWVAIGSVILVPWTPSTKLSPQRDIPSDRRMAAIDLYSQGHLDVLFRTDSGRRRAMDLFRQAIAIDSTYAPAHASLAHMISSQFQREGRRELLALAERHARTSVVLDPSLAAGHAAVGHVLLDDYRLAEAETSLLRAHELSVNRPLTERSGLRPEYAGEFLVWLYVFMDRPRDALHFAELNAKANPEAPTAISELARAMMVNGRCDDALSLLSRFSSLELRPARSAAIAAQCYAQRELWQEAIEGLRPVAAHNPGQAEAWLAFMLARAGQIAEALAIRDRLLARVPATSRAYELATVYAGLREHDKAFEWLDRAIDDRSLQYSIMEPGFAELRRDPRFDRVRQRLGLQR